MSVRIACAQVAPKVGDGERNRAAALVAVREAVGAGARIVDPDGWLAAGPVDGYGQGILYADCDLGLDRDKAWGERNDVVGDLRPELYPTARPASDPSRTASSSERGESLSPTSTAP